MPSEEQSKARWYDFDHLLAIVVGRYGFVLGDKGWHSVAPSSIVAEGQFLPNAEEAIYNQSLIWLGIDREATEACVRFGMLPPPPRRIRRWVCVEQVQVISGKNDLAGKIFVEFDDGWMKPLNGKELAALAQLVPGLRNWRISGKPNYD